MGQGPPNRVGEKIGKGQFRCAFRVSKPNCTSVISNCCVTRTIPTAGNWELMAEHPTPLEASLANLVVSSPTLWIPFGLLGDIAGFSSESGYRSGLDSIADYILLLFEGICAFVCLRIGFFWPLMDEDDSGFWMTTDRCIWPRYKWLRVGTRLAPWQMKPRRW